MASVRRLGVMYVWSVLAAVGAVACSEPAAPEEGSTEQDVLTNCGITYVPSAPIKFDRELVIRDLHVVQDQTPDANDHCRTTWNSACPLNLQGRWTFGWMMSAMAGTSDVTSPTAKAFVKNWLKLWLSPQQPNPNKAPVAPRTAIVETLIKPWLDASNCPSTATIDTCDLDLKKAPFRLLAFVNRVDLPAIGGYSAGGEFRVVFGALGVDPNNPSSGSSATLQATVILEYNYPATASLLSWANQMHALSALDPTSLTPVPPNGFPSTVQYRNQLQAITDAIVGPNLLPLGFTTNRSSISHVRTNEIAFDCQSGTQLCNGVAPDSTQAQWEARQFKLGGPTGSTGQFLVQDTVSQTPQTSDNLTPAINNQLITYQNDCLIGKPAFQPADAALLGNASQSPSGFNGTVVWEPNVLNSTTAPSLSSADRLLARHHFAFGTCNGCHYIETSNQLGFFHVAPRDDGYSSGLSSFLSVNGAADPLASTDNQNPTYYQTVNNPTGGSTTFKYNEPWRRACEIRRILSGSTTPYTNPTGHLNQ